MRVELMVVCVCCYIHCDKSGYMCLVPEWAWRSATMCCLKHSQRDIRLPSCVCDNRRVHVDNVGMEWVAPVSGLKHSTGTIPFPRILRGSLSFPRTPRGILPFPRTRRGILRSLQQFHVVGGEQTTLPVYRAHPPALVHLVDVLQDVIRVERDFVVARCGGTAEHKHTRCSMSSRRDLVNLTH